MMKMQCGDRALHTHTCTMSTRGSVSWTKRQCVQKVQKEKRRKRDNSRRRDRIKATCLQEGQQFSSTAVASHLRLAVIGDLHLSQPEMAEYFQPAREDIVSALNDNNNNNSINNNNTSEKQLEHPGAHRKNFIVQVGDLGAYEANPGSRECFQYAKSYLESFCTLESDNENVAVSSATTDTVRLHSQSRRPLLVTGNHDLEGKEFETDVENLECWKSMFEQNHYWLEEHGQWLFIGLSTTRFRSNVNSCHEVYIDKEQRDWLEETLDYYQALEAADGRKRRAVIFTHAPPAGAGIRVVHNVHVKNRCAWLNHSDEEGVRFFMELLSRKGDMIALWCNGHFHLSHDYYDSISVVGQTAFVQVGVIGSCHRDGKRQSRLIDLYDDGYKVSTIDHNQSKIRVDMEHSFSESKPVPYTLDKECYLSSNDSEDGTQRDVFVDDDGVDFLMRSMDSCSILPDKGLRKPSTNENNVWHSTGVSELYVNTSDNVIVEYDLTLLTPIGVVHNKLGNRSVRLVDIHGNVVNTAAGENGARAVAVELYNTEGIVEERIERNAGDKYFYKVFQVNKWQKRLAEQKALERISEEKVIESA